MRFCFCSIAFRNDPIEAIIPRLAPLGYDAVEIFWKQLEGKSDDELHRIRSLADEHKLGIEVISPYFWLTQSPELLRDSMQIAEQVIHAARILGCPKVRTFTDAGPTGIASAKATPEQWENAVQALRKITQSAPDLLFPVETHALTLADTPESTRLLMERVGAPNLKVIYQAMSKDRLVEEFELLRPHIVHIHLANHDAEGTHGPIEEGVLPLAELVRHAAATEYQGTASVEYCHRGSTWKQAASAIRWLRELVGEIR